MKSNISVIDINENGNGAVVYYKSGKSACYTRHNIPQTVKRIFSDVTKNPSRYLCERVEMPAVSGDARTGYKYYNTVWYRVTVL